LFVFDPEPPEGALVFVPEPFGGSLGFLPDCAKNCALADGGSELLVFEPEPPPGLPPPPPPLPESQPVNPTTSNAPAVKPRMFLIFFMLLFWIRGEPLSLAIGDGDSGRSLSENNHRGDVFQETAPIPPRGGITPTLRVSQWKVSVETCAVSRTGIAVKYVCQNLNPLSASVELDGSHPAPACPPQNPAHKKSPTTYAVFCFTSLGSPCDGSFARIRRTE